MTAQGVKGLVGQSMSGRRPPLTPVVALFPILTTTTWVVPRNGVYRFVIWAGGSNGVSNTRSGGAGQLYIAERPLTKGQIVTIVSGAAAALSRVTLPNGEVITAQPASGITGGASSVKNAPNDVVVNGANGTNTGTDTGPSGPSYLEYQGGAGGTSGTSHDAYVPGGGGGSASTVGAPGLVLAHQVRLQR